MVTNDLHRTMSMVTSYSSYWSSQLPFDTWSLPPSWNTFFIWFPSGPLFIGSFSIADYSSHFFHFLFIFWRLHIGLVHSSVLGILINFTSWAVVLNPACILESRGELLKDADALAPLHHKWIRSSGVYTQSDIAHSTPFAQKFLLQVPRCWNWEPKS